MSGSVARAAFPKHNLPVQLIPFVGCEALLAEIAGLLQDPACRLLTLVGPGGSGKTRLALEAAAKLLPTGIEPDDVLSETQSEDFEHGVFFVSLAPLDAADLIVPTVAQSLGFTFEGGVEPRQQPPCTKLLGSGRGGKWAGCRDCAADAECWQSEGSVC